MTLKYFYVNIYIILFSALLVSCQSSAELRREQFSINGKPLYEKHCSNCHGKDGKGLGNLYPPLLKSDYLQNINATVCIIKNGRLAPLKVNGKVYNQIMPKLKLYDIDIAQITTYLYSVFEKKDTLIDTPSVQSIKCYE